MGNKEKEVPEQKSPRVPFGFAGPVDPNNWPGDPPMISEQEIAEIIEADVVVVSGGHAGLHCSLAAAEGGAKVVVIEKRFREK